MSKVSFPLSKVYGLLEPGPVVLVTTAKVGRTKIMTLSWHIMLEFEPPLVGCVISNGKLQFRYFDGNSGMRDQYSNGRAG